MIFSDIKAEIDGHHATLVAVSKTHLAPAILSIYDQGQRIFGENRVQELHEKRTALPDDIQWHLIGHLQRNKVKLIAPYISMIQSVDSLKLAKEIDIQAKKHDRIIPILVQAKVAQEATKFGLAANELLDPSFWSSLSQLPNLAVQGIMGMGTYTTDKDITMHEFNSLKSLYDQIKARYFSEVSSFQYLSMGMSGDYTLALKCGSNMVRLGSILFR